MNSKSDRLLIVDDNEMNRDMLARRLTRKGYSVTVADSAHQLEDRIKQEKVDLLLLDIEMPEISGLDALSKIRQTYSAAQLPVIMVTAKNQSEDIVIALELGANDYLTKPVDFPVALARIGNQLSYKHTEKALRESEERYALAARGSNDGLWDWNLVDQTVYFSPRWKSMLGHPETEIGDQPAELFDRIHSSDKDQVDNAIAAHLKGETAHLEAEARLRHKNGTYRWMLIRGMMVCDESGAPHRMAGSQTDITGGKVADPLTGLPNRLLFLDRLVQRIDYRKRHPEDLFAVLFLDLDGFKMVNDSLGHLAGDKLLVEVAERLETVLRSTDTVTRLDDEVTLARLGGDEFAILLNELHLPSDVAAVADRLLSELNRPFKIDDKEIYTTVSIGIAVSTLDYQTAEEFLRDADTAMYRAKSLGKARYEIFDGEMRASVIERLQLETDLRHGIERDEFRNFYQPIISLDSGKIVGFEALVRWQHPGRGLVGPNEFIPVAEETGLIRDMGWQVLERACAQLAEWRKLVPDYADLTMSVNLSVRQFPQPHFAERVEALLGQLGLPENSLKLEITESSLMSDPVAAVNLLSRLKELGVRLAIDDFGTGYSSLSYLQRFPLDTLKIDRSFTMAMGSGQKEETIVSSIMRLAQKLGLDVVAEGVETEEQLVFLKEVECKFAQGFYFSKPMRAEDAEKLMMSPAMLAGTMKSNMSSDGIVRALMPELAGIASS
ncbi:MAG TPA: EAL domain-containing protein [Terriglobia bacterium]|jgi:diguanylate cyclase (GGDEF)-like protein/PAS domain S-box-containing protein